MRKSNCVGLGVDDLFAWDPCKNLAIAAARRSTILAVLHRVTNLYYASKVHFARSILRRKKGEFNFSSKHIVSVPSFAHSMSGGFHI